MSAPADRALAVRLQLALADLPERQREIFLAVRQDAASYAELASRYSIDVVEVERELARALVALADAVDGKRPSWRRLVLRTLRRRLRW